jgi:SAM-dependent methyltransferase
MTEQHDTSRWHEAFDKMLEDPEYHMANALRSNALMLQELMKAVDVKAVLEVGCGSARMSALLKRLRPDYKITASDVDAQVCDAARMLLRKLKVVLEVECFDALSVPYPDQSWDVVISQGLVEHYEDDWIRKFVAEQTRVARWLYLDIPLAHMIMAGHAYGDERRRFAHEWLAAVARDSYIGVMHLLGQPGEEEYLVLALTREPGQPWTRL